MNFHEKCEIARVMTGCNEADKKIIEGVSSMNVLVKEEASKMVDILLKRDNNPFDKAFPLMKNDFMKIANKYEINTASLFWVYMEWQVRNKNEGE